MLLSLWSQFLSLFRGPTQLPEAPAGPNEDVQAQKDAPARDACSPKDPMWADTGIIKGTLWVSAEETVWSTAVKMGLIMADQPNDLGAVHLVAPAHLEQYMLPEEIAQQARAGKSGGFLRAQDPREDVLGDTVDRDCWVTRFILSGDLQHVQVTSIVVAGIPLDIGPEGLPAEAFSAQAVQPVGTDRRLVRPGQGVSIHLRYLGQTEASVMGAFLSAELAPRIQPISRAQNALDPKAMEGLLRTGPVAPTLVGYAPVYRDASGTLYVDPDGIRFDSDPGDPQHTDPA